MVVIDLANLRCRHNPTQTAVAANTAQGELLAAVDLPPGTPTRESAFLAFDAALDRGRVRRVDLDGTTRTLRIALYNPFTAEVAVGPVPKTRVFSAHHRLELPPAGLVGTIITPEKPATEDRDDADEELATLELSDGTILELVIPSANSVTRAVAAHLDAT